MNAATKARYRAESLEVGASILDRLAARGTSLYALSQATGIPYSTLHKKVRRGNSLNIAEFAKIAHALDMDPGDLLPVRA